MRIAVFYNLPFSGAKRLVLEHVKGLKKLGHHVDVYTTDSEHDIFSPGELADNEYRYPYGKIIISAPVLRKISNDISDFYLLKRLHRKIAQDIDSRGYDVALVHTDKITQAPFLLQFLETKKVYFCLEPLKIAYEYGLRTPDSLPLTNRIYEALNRSFRKKIDRDNARASDEILTISNFGRELVIQAFDLYPKVSYLGVDISSFKNLKISKKNQVLFVGQKLKMNGYDYALNAIKLIPAKNRPVLKILSISSNKDERLTDDEIVRSYNESFVTISLSNFDTFGLVALESLACETPVIAFNVAGYRETMIDNKTGYLVDFDAKEIAHKIEFFLNNKDIAREMGTIGREWVTKKWSWEISIKKLEYYLQVCLKKTNKKNE